MTEEPNGEIVRRQSADTTLGSSDIIRRGLEDSLALTRRQKIRIMHVDDIVETRELIRNLLQFETDMEIVASLRVSQEAIEHYPILKPDIVISDINRPGMSGLVMVRILCDLDPNAKIIIFSVVATQPEVMRMAMYAGVRESIAKPARAKELISTILAVHEEPNSSAPFWRAPRGVDVGFYHLDRWQGIDTRLGGLSTGSLHLGIGWRNRWRKCGEFLLKDIDPSDVALLDFSGGKLSPHIQSALQLFPGVEAINLESCRVSKTTAGELREIKNLRKLWLQRAWIEKDALDDLAEIPSLEMLQLDHARAEAAPLGNLKGIPNLKYLSIEGWNLSTQAVERLRAMLQLEHLRT